MNKRASKHVKEVISPEYRELNRQKHLGKGRFGSGGSKQLKNIQKFIPLDGDILDYGCGKRTFEKALGRPIANYDPAIAGVDEPPEPHDYVVCTDVLEHVEPEYVKNVIRDLRRVTKKMAYLRISLDPAHKTLPDGSDPHRSVHDAGWWTTEVGQRFKIIHSEETPGWLDVVVE